MKSFASWLLSLAVIGVCCSHAGGHREAQAPEAKPIFTQTQRLVVVMPKSRKLLAAYSVSLNQWSKIDVSADPLIDVEPVVSDGLAACQIGQTVYAFSAKTAAWGTLDLPEKSKARFTVDATLVSVTDDGVLYIFGENARQWSKIDLTTGETTPALR